MNKQTVYSVLLVLFSTCFAYLTIEVGVRSWLWYKYANGNFKTIATWKTTTPARDTEQANSEPGKANTNTTYFYWLFDENSNIVFSTKYPANNLGLPSWHDYYPKNASSEFGIAIVGDSFTASLQMSTPWPDKLEVLLNDDKKLRSMVGGKVFRVYNYGLPAAGFPEFSYLAQQAKILDPDLLILNYIAGDFPRCNSCGQVSDNAVKDKTNALVHGTIRIPTSENKEEDVFLKMACEREPISFDNDSCRHSFSLEMPPRVAGKPELVRKAKQTIVQNFLRGQLWSSKYPYALRLFSGQPVSLQDFRSVASNGGKTPAPRELSEEEMVAQAVRTINTVRELYPNVIITLNPTYDDLTWQPSEELTFKMMRAANVDVVRMRHKLPAGLSKEEYMRWYCLPHDGHMSDAGGDEYAKAMKELIGERLKSMSHSE